MQNATETALIVGEMRGDIKSLTNTVEKIADTTEQINNKISVMSTAITDAHDRISDLIGNDNKKITHEDLREAIEAVQKVSGVLDAISGAAREQQLGIGQINEAVAQMDSITQQNATLVEELASTARSLTMQAQGVSHSMRLFRLQRGEHTLTDVDAVALRRQGKGG